MLRDRWGGMGAIEVPNCSCTAFPHMVRKGKGTAEVRSENLKATIRRRRRARPRSCRSTGHRNQFGIRSKSTMLGQLDAIEPRARHVVEKPRLRYCFCLCIGIPNRSTVG